MESRGKDKEEDWVKPGQAGKASCWSAGAFPRAAVEKMDRTGRQEDMLGLGTDVKEMPHEEKQTWRS